MPARSSPDFWYCWQIYVERDIQSLQRAGDVDSRHPDYGRVLNVPEKDIGLYRLGKKPRSVSESHPGWFLRAMSRASSLIDP